MNSVLKTSILILFLIWNGQTKAFSQKVGQITGTLILDDSWERKIYVSYIKTLEKEYVVSNDLIITSSLIDSLGNFKIELNQIPTNWSLLRLHVVKKGVSPNSLIIGSSDENFMLLVAKRDSELALFNTENQPIFSDTRVEGAGYMNTFNHIKKLYNYPNSIDYDNTIIEKGFIRDVVSEKLKMIADSCSNPLVSLYAIYQTDFQSDFLQDSKFYEIYFSKWETENSSYFESFRQKFPDFRNNFKKEKSSNYYIFLAGIVGILLVSALVYFKKKNRKIEHLSIQERKIFDLLRNGLSNKEISSECNIALTTVKSHVGNIYSKLNIASRKEAMNFKIKS